MAVTAKPIPLPYELSPNPPRTAEGRFFERFALGLAALIVFGFGQFELRGMVDLAAVPLATHVHAAVMVGWLALLVVQPRLAGAGASAWHRRLGWAGALLAVAMVAITLTALVAALRLGRVPPFFSPGFYLGLVVAEAAGFAALVCWGLARRRDTVWHRRLLVGATIVAMEPALGRILPMPLLGLWGEWLAMAGQLFAVWLMARHDIRQFSRTHPATLAVAAMVVATHGAAALAGISPPVQALAAGLAAG